MRAPFKPRSATGRRLYAFVVERTISRQTGPPRPEVRSRVWAKPELRGRGYGAAAMRRVLQLAFEQGVPHVDLVVKRDNVGGNRLAQSVGLCS